MKAIFFVALLVFAAQASLLDTTSYSLGFDTQLGLDTSAVVTGLECFQALNTTIATAVELIQDFRNDPSSAIMTGINLLTTINGNVKVNCELYFQDLVTLVLEATNSTDIELEEIKEVVEQNAKFFTPQLLQQAANLFDALVAGDSYKAGTTEAYILQILLGLQKPKEIEQHAFNFSQYVPLDAQKYISEFTQAYYTKLGANSEASSAYVQCYNSILTGEPAIANFFQQFAAASGIVEKVQVVQNSSDDLMEVIEYCLPAIEYNLELFAPVWEEIKESPIRTILTIVHNIAANAPELEQIAADETFEVFTGEYAEAGDEAASAFITAFGGAGY